MSRNSTAHVTGMEEQVADLIGWQRRLRGAVFEVREDLPLSMRFALDRACKAPPEELMTSSGLEEASEVSPRLRSLIRELGGAPTLCHTEEGDPYTIGGTETGRRVEILLECLNEFLRQAWRTTDLLMARTVLENAPCGCRRGAVGVDMI